MKKTFLILVLALSFLQCDNKSTEEDCSTVLCYAPGFNLIILDANTNENLIKNNTYTANNIKVLDTDNNAISFQLNKDLENPNLYVYLETSETEQKAYSFTLQNSIQFEANIAIEKIGDGSECCGAVLKINSISVIGVTSNINVADKLITVYIE